MDALLLPNLTHSTNSSFHIYLENWQSVDYFLQLQILHLLWVDVTNLLVPHLYACYFCPFANIADLIWGTLLCKMNIYPSLLLMIQVIQGIHKWAPDQDITKGVTIDRAIAICRARRPRPHGPRPQHPCHWQIKAIISHHRRCFPRFGDLSILDRSMLWIFRRQKLQYI